MSNREKAEAWFKTKAAWELDARVDSLTAILDANDADLVELCGNAASSAAHDAGAYWVETAVYDACLSVLK